MPAKRRRRAIACLAAAAPTKALRLGGLRRPRPPPSIPRAGAETVAEHIAEDPRHTEAMREEVVVSSAMTARECVRRVREAPASWGRSGRVWVNGQDGRFAGYVGASQLLLAEPDASLAFLAKPPEAVLRADEDLDDALARVVNRGGSGALPVVDSNGALVGALAPGEVMVELEQARARCIAWSSMWCAPARRRRTGLFHTGGDRRRRALRRHGRGRVVLRVAHPGPGLRARRVARGAARAAVGLVRGPGLCGNQPCRRAGDASMARRY